MSKINLITFENGKFLSPFARLDTYAGGLDWAYQFSLVSWGYEQFAADNAKCEADYTTDVSFRRDLLYALPIKDLAMIVERMARSMNFSVQNYKRKEDYNVALMAIRILSSRVEQDLVARNRDSRFEDLPTNWRSLVRQVRENYHDNKEATR